MEQQRHYGSGGSGAPSVSGKSNGSSSTVTIRGGGGIVQVQAAESRAARANDLEADKNMFVDDRDQDRTIRGLEDLPRQHFIKPAVEEEDEDTVMTDVDSNKDLFLSLAKADPPKLLRGLNTKTRVDDRKVSHTHK